MSGFVWSRETFHAILLVVESIALVTATLVLIGACASLLARALVGPPAPRWWEPIPERLEPAAEPYGAPSLKRHYRQALLRSLGIAALVHASFGAFVALLLIAPAQEEKPYIVKERPEGTDIIIIPPPESPESQGSKGTPLPEIPDPRNIVVAPVEAQTQLTLIDPLETFVTSPDGDPFGSRQGTPEGVDGSPDPRPSFGVPDTSRTPGSRDFVPVDQLPELITMPEPVYPEIAKLSGLEGVVELMILVGRDGRVRRVDVTRSIPGLDDAATKAAGKARFRPALWKGEPVAVWVSLPIRFTLRTE